VDDDVRPYDVFLCYSWADSASAEALNTALGSEGLKVFQDKIDGEVFAPLGISIRQALDRSLTRLRSMGGSSPATPTLSAERSAP
jgi:TIR domain